MSDHLDRFDRDFRTRGRALRRTPAARNWNRIEGRLDRRSRRTTLAAVRPWMIAALFVLAAGLAVISHLTTERLAEPLARAVESVEELNAPVPVEQVERMRYTDYAPIEEGSGREGVVGRGERVGRLVVAEAYRGTGG